MYRVFGPRTSNVGKGLAKATREDVVIFGAISLGLQGPFCLVFGPSR